VRRAGRLEKEASVVDVEVRGLEASTVDLEVRVVVDAVNHHDVVSFFLFF
jgi:hypothetical protein